MSDFELGSVRVIQEGSRVIYNGDECILLGSFRARKNVFMILIKLESGHTLSVNANEPLGFLENLMIDELLSHDNEHVREWFSGLVKGEYSREYLAAWFMSVEDEHKILKRKKEFDKDHYQKMITQLMHQAATSASKLDFRQQKYSTGDFTTIPQTQTESETMALRRREYMRQAASMMQNSQAKLLGD